jgi:zinc protease
MVLSVSGDVDGGSLIEAVKKVFGTLRKEEEMVLNRINISKHAAKKAIEMEKDQSLVLLGFPGADVRNPDRYAIDVMSSVLSGQSGRMFADLRNIQSLAYTLGCFQKTAIDTGLIVFYIATVSDKIADAKTGIAKEIDKIKKEPVTQEELDAAKRSLVSARRSAMQTNAFYSMTSALDELYGLGYDNLYKYKSEIEKVTAEDLRVAALKYFDENGAVEVVISPRAQ